MIRTSTCRGFMMHPAHEREVTAYCFRSCRLSECDSIQYTANVNTTITRKPQAQTQVRTFAIRPIAAFHRSCRIRVRSGALQDPCELVRRLNGQFGRQGSACYIGEAELYPRSARAPLQLWNRR